MEDLDFRQSDADPCLFISPIDTLLCYCDDCLLLYKYPAAVDILTNQMKEAGMLFEAKILCFGYLGVLLD